MLYGTINDLSLSVVEFRPYFKSQTTKEVINSKISILLPAMQAFANNKLDNGYKIPVPDNIAKYVKNQKVEPRQGYLLIDGNPDFSKVLPDSTKLRQPRQLQALADLTPGNFSHQRFYDLVQKVYLLKL